ncbi:MAG: tripartite tricarboxylate transporter TctB family protein [Treponema sp.]|nr:tripartite tricarboxylate transporter TctB family protein [Treponema sp.]
MENEFEVKNGESAGSDKELISGARADFITSMVLFLFGLFVFFESVRMPIPSHARHLWFTSPGFFPAFLGIMLVFTSIMLFYRSFRVLRSNNTFLSFSSAVAVIKSKTTARLGLALAFLIMYVFVLLGNIHYIAATFIYMLANIVVFDAKERTPRRLLLQILTAAIVAVVIAVAFRDLGRIPLP